MLPDGSFHKALVVVELAELFLGAEQQNPEIVLGDAVLAADLILGAFADEVVSKDPGITRFESVEETMHTLAPLLFDEPRLRVIAWIGQVGIVHERGRLPSGLAVPLLKDVVAGVEDVAR